MFFFHGVTKPTFLYVPAFRDFGTSRLDVIDCYSKTAMREILTSRLPSFTDTDYQLRSTTPFHRVIYRQESQASAPPVHTEIELKTDPVGGDMQQWKFAANGRLLGVDTRKWRDSDWSVGEKEESPRFNLAALCAILLDIPNTVWQQCTCARSLHYARAAR